MLAVSARILRPPCLHIRLHTFFLNPVADSAGRSEPNDSPVALARREIGVGRASTKSKSQPEHASNTLSRSPSHSGAKAPMADAVKQTRQIKGSVFRRETRALFIAGLIAGAVGGATGSVVLLTFVAGIPLLLLLLLLCVGRALWLTVARLRAFPDAMVFACSLCVAQWPFTRWLLPKFFDGAGPSSIGSLPLTALVGFAIAPQAITFVRARALVRSSSQP